jgi:hypothetical protein
MNVSAAAPTVFPSRAATKAGRLNSGDKICSTSAHAAARFFIIAACINKQNTFHVQGIVLSQRGEWQIIILLNFMVPSRSLKRNRMQIIHLLFGKFREINYFQVYFYILGFEKLFPL